MRTITEILRTVSTGSGPNIMSKIEDLPDYSLGDIFPSSLTYYLALQGYYFFSQIKDLSTDDLLKIKGIGLRTINNVVKRIAEVASEIKKGSEK